MEGRYWLLVVMIFFSGFTPEETLAFGYNDSSATAYMDAATFPARTGNVTSLTSGGASVRASGYPNSSFKDMVKIYSVEFNSQIQNRGFTLEVKVGNSEWMEPSAAVGKCVWADDKCTVSYSSSLNNYPTVAVYIRLKKNNTATYTTIPTNTLIATIRLRMNNYGAYDSTLLPLYFRFNGSVTPVVPTCDVKNFDNTVTLPEVKRADLISQGSGRYNGVTKEFTINLACENTPKVSVKFDGDKLPGITSEDVLVNKLTGNDNVGVQILYNSNPLKISEKVAVLSSAGASEALKFNAYYYYKGGTVQSGPIKSQTEFTFSYE
ncbi:Fimbrial-type adhesion domain-containing protein [Phytobacter sp. AG2a]